jgi:hypothetical protein
MKFWDIFSGITGRLLFRKYFRKLDDFSLEVALKGASGLIDDAITEEIRIFIKAQQTREGGFADRGGKCDLYYTLFGGFVSEALDVKEVFPALRKYIRETVRSGNPEGIYLHCMVILWTKFCGKDPLPEKVRKEFIAGLADSVAGKAAYDTFLNLLTCYYTRYHTGLFRLWKIIRVQVASEDVPCSVLAAELVVAHLRCLPTGEMVSRLLKFQRKDGSFSASLKVPAGDLLSTAVALYALKFADHDLTLIKPACLAYADALYCCGGFCAALSEENPDMEYTFYGLLALGSLNQ